MIREPFAYGNSVLHRFDPRFKLAWASVYSFVVAFSNAFSTLAAAMAFSCLLLFMARLNLREVGGRLAIVNVLMLFFWLVLPLTHDGDPMFEIAGFDVSRQGVLLCARITLKSNAILVAFIALIATSPITALGQARAGEDD